MQKNSNQSRGEFLQNSFSEIYVLGKAKTTTVLLPAALLQHKIIYTLSLFLKIYGLRLTSQIYVSFSRY